MTQDTARNFLAGSSTKVSPSVAKGAAGLDALGGLGGREQGGVRWTGNGWMI